MTLWQRFYRHIDPGYAKAEDMKRFRLKVSVEQGFRIPRLYSPAWREWDRDCTVCFIWPLNLLFGLVRRIWIAIRWKMVPDLKLNTEAKAYCKGMKVATEGAIKLNQSVGNRIWAEGFEFGRDFAISVYQDVLDDSVAADLQYARRQTAKGE